MPFARIFGVRAFCATLSAILLLVCLAAGCAAQNGKGADARDALPQAVVNRQEGIPLAWRDLPAPPGRAAFRPLLLVTGFGMTGEGWNREFVHSLNSGRRVILLENRGTYAAAGLPAGTPVDLPAMAADAVRLLDALGIARADVLGWSMGGSIALELALARPERVGALALYAPASSGAAVKPKLDRMFAMSPQEFKAALFPTDWAAAHPEVFAALPPAAPLPEGMPARQYEALVAWPGVAGRLPGLRVPALFLVGEADWVCPPHEVRILAEATPGARLELVPQGGHWMMHQEPRRLARILDGFFSGQP